MHLRSLRLFLLLFSSGGRRLIHIDDSHRFAHKQSSTLSNGVEVAREALIPGGFGKGVFRRTGRKEGSLRKGCKQDHWRTGHLEPARAAPCFRSGPDRANVALVVQAGVQDSAMVDLNALLSTCVDAASRGCAEIRAVQSRRDGGGHLPVTLKNDSDARSALTEADLAAQAAMVGALREAWPGLSIIGEEGDDTVAATRPDAPTPLRRDLCAELGAPSLFAPLDELVVFVDPLDGTREYVEGRLSHVQSLVGVARRGRPVAGAIGLPFPSGSLAGDAAVVYALVGAGVGTLGSRPQDPPSDAARPIVTTGDSSNKCLGAAKRAALRGGGSELVMGGAGHKIVAAAEGRADLAIMHFGTSLWDSCAPGAFIMAMGGKMTDLFGAPLVHAASPGADASAVKNKLGVVASAPGQGAAHDALCAAMRAEPLALALLQPDGFLPDGGSGGGASSGATAQAADLVRDLSGAPLTTPWLEKALGDGGSGRPALLGYDAPEAASFRGMMSNGCRLQLRWCGGGAGAVVPSSLFYKRVVMGELDSARAKALSAPAKLQRDVNSFFVEARFLGSKAAAELLQARVLVPRAHRVEMWPDAVVPIESRFALLLSDFSPSDGWRQEGALSPLAVRSSLETLARLHAYFWEGSSFWQHGSGGDSNCGSGAAAELEGAVWPAGGYSQPSMQPEDQWTQLSAKMAGHVAKFGDDFAAAPALQGIDLGALGDRLQSVARAEAAKVHPFDVTAGGDAVAMRRYRTLIHGDPKAANLFLRDTEASSGGVEVALIDFQWTGFGLAATDVAHHLAAALAPEALSLDGAAEAALLNHYHEVLCGALAEFGAAESAADAAARLLPRPTLQQQYESALLDMGRLVFAYQWSRANFGAPAPNKNSYNKYMQTAVWLTVRCDALLRARGV